MHRLYQNLFALWLSSLVLTSSLQSQEIAFQPLQANLHRVLATLDFLGAPLPPETRAKLDLLSPDAEIEALTEIVDSHVAFFVDINPEVRVKVSKRSAPITLQQGGFTPVLVKVSNQSTSTETLRITSPQALPVYAGMSALSAFRMQRQAEKEIDVDTANSNRFLDLEIYSSPPMTEQLSGLSLEYAIALIYARDAGTYEATIGFDLGQGNQDIGFRGEVPVILQVRRGVRVALKIRDHDGRPTTGKFVFRGPQGEIYPPQAKRLAPDFYFQEQIYRPNGGTVTLPPGPITVSYSRGPEYRVLTQQAHIPNAPEHLLEFNLERWINPAEHGFYSGDHHIHGAGCAHYAMPTLGVMPSDMFQQIKGEALNVGCVLTWGPCFEFQRQFFQASVDALSEPFTAMKYDLEISGFGSAALGHVCLLNLKDQTYPNSNGTKTEGWPTWTTPVLRWAKEQGAITGYAHSASGLQINPASAAQRLIVEHDRNQDQVLDSSECAAALLPASFATIDRNQDRALSRGELESALDIAADTLPNLAIPEMNSVGAMEIGVTVAAGLCDFISAMDTARIPEWNMFYHLLNCGFPLKVSGETDFPCMSGSRVGQGRVYVQLGDVQKVDFSKWCEGLAAGRSYVSDGFAHALDFSIEDKRPGGIAVQLDAPRPIQVSTLVAFAPSTPLSVAQGQIKPIGGPRFVGDTVTFHGSPTAEYVDGGDRTVELIVNGRAVARKTVPADGNKHALEWTIPIKQSSWVALRHFPQLHTNPINVLVANRPIRASAASARWVQETIRQLWSQRQHSISEEERVQADQTFQWALKRYREIEGEARDLSTP